MIPLVEASKLFPAMLLGALFETLRQHDFPTDPWSVKHWLITSAFVFWLGVTAPGRR